MYPFTRWTPYVTPWGIFQQVVNLQWHKYDQTERDYLLIIWAVLILRLHLKRAHLLYKKTMKSSKGYLDFEYQHHAAIAFPSGHFKCNRDGLHLRRAPLDGALIPFLR